MNNYHIYEEIGRGKYSVVYKVSFRQGRKKKTIEYAAVKSVEKSRRPKVLNEVPSTQVQILHNLSHSNILQFFNWYETRNHLWLIFEYCPGGTLLSVLEQDHILPETTVREFGKDLVSGLLFLHSHGIIYADLKPSNLLLNEFGTLKYADFGLSRRIVDLVADEQEKGKPKRGTPFYMAPELFQAQGVYSFYSDFWALGCVLYEMASGQPPFNSDSFQTLVTQILTSPLPQIPTATSAFNQLLQDLMEKDPAQRVSWPELLSHPFWGPGFHHEEAYLPEQPHYDAYLRDRGIAQRTLAQQFSPIQISAETRSDILRISLTINKNMRKKQGQEGSSDQVNGSRDVLLKDRDQELDFAEHTGEEEVDDTQELINGAGFTRSETDLTPMEKSGFGQEKPMDFLASRTIPSSSKQRGGETVQPDTPSRSGFKPAALEQLLIHQSDLAVKPIFGNREIEKAEASVSTENLPFRAWTSDEVSSMPDSPEFQSHLDLVFAAISAHVSPQRLPVLSYLQQLISSSAVANRVINSSFFPALLKILKSTKLVPAKIRICTVFGQMLRHATLINVSVAESGLVQTLAECVKEKSEKVRRKAAAAMGEYCFYAATQMDEKDCPPEWEISANLSQFLIRCLRPGEDEIVRLYICKTIENILAQSKAGGKRFAVQELIPLVSSLYETTGSDQIRTSAAVAISHVVRVAPELAGTVMSQVTVRNVVAGLTEGQTRIQQAWMTFLLVCLQDQDLNIATELGKETDLIPLLVSLLEHPVIVIRGKSLLLCLYLFQHSPSLLSQVSDTKFFPSLERAAKDSYKYVQSCLHYLINALISVVSRIVGDMGRNVGEERTTAIALAPVILQVMNCSPVKARFPYKDFIISLAELLTKAEGLTLPENEQFSGVVLLLLESLGSNPPALLSNVKVVVSHLLPSLLSQQRNKSSQVRFMCLKIFSDVLSTVLTDPNVHNSANSAESLTRLEEFIAGSVIPLYPQMLNDEDPIPVYAVKILSGLMERDGEVVQSMIKQGTVERLMRSFDGNSRRLTVHLVKVVKHIIESKLLTQPEFQKLNLVEKVNSVLQRSKEQDWCTDLLLDIVFELLLSTVETMRRDGSESALGFAEPLLDWFPVCVKRLGPEGSERIVYCLTLMLQLYEFLEAMIQVLECGSPPLQLRVLKLLKKAVSANVKFDRNLTAPILEELSIHVDKQIAQSAS